MQGAGLRLGANLTAALLALKMATSGGSAGERVDLASIDIEQGLSVKQTRFVRDKARKKAVKGGRRAGKTVAFRRALLMAAAAYPGRYSLYISLTRKLAKKTLWQELKADCRTLGIPFAANETELTLTIVGGGTIILGGADDSLAVERYRGLAYVLVIIDECGSQKDALLRLLVLDVLRPAMMDYGGQLVLGGTPGPALVGYWYEMSGPQRVANCPLYEWTIFDNPLFDGRAAEELAEIRLENEWTEQTVTYVREYLGRWIQDASVLVYPFDVAKNLIVALPTHTSSGYRVRDQDWSWRLGMDCGIVDLMTFVVVGAHRALPGSYICHAEGYAGMLTGQVGAKIREIHAFKRSDGSLRFPRMRNKLDTGGMGKVHAEELTRMHGIVIEAAVKTEKASTIRTFRDRLLAGGVQLLDVPELDCLRAEWATLGWDAKQEQHDPNGEDHYSDATIYADRDLKAYRWDPSRGKPAAVPGTPEHMAEMERQEMEREAAQERRQAGRAGWNR